ncbi:MAG: DUF1553 domain-containing protein [Planctomycetales bacterium]|nr:DUF1553 domain-containing protein [Planctomycetales bacterium]
MSFFRGLNLNGPAVLIDGNRWEGGTAESYRCDDRQFENQNIALHPVTDRDRAAMIRSSRYGGNRVELLNVPPGEYSILLYVWEDNDTETYSVALNSETVLERHESGIRGHWDRLGPWTIQVGQEATIVVTSKGGTANFSGIEVWRGNYDGQSRPITEEELAFFEKRIRPLLADKCYECHSADADDVQGELLVDSRDTLRRGGTKGPAVVLGDVEQSLLVEAVSYENDEMQMPPDQKLSDTEIDDLKRWILMGAPDPRSTVTKYAGKQIDVDQAREFWSLQPIQNVVIPQVHDLAWPLNAVDRFVLASMEQHSLAPATDADKRALLRRATYDLIGLPPTPAEVDAFLADDSQDAYAKVVERLLGSPRYGERWGRHWLDVVRYADTAGDNSDYPIPQMHRYRDWVISAFNRDLPYDEFVRDQLAGDLRGGNTEAERRDRLIATGYLANSRRFGSRVVDYPQHLTIEDTIDNLGRSFLGLTLSCARCHDHKFDPITNRDYYGLYGIFHSTRYPWPGIELDKKQRDFVPLVEPESVQDAERKLRERLAEQQRLAEAVKTLKESLKKANPETKPAVEQELKKAEQQARAHRELPPPFETAYAVAESKTTEDVAIQLKGDPARPGDVVPRRFLTVLGGQQLTDPHASGRLQLAEWLLADDNPLPARVMVNRIWQHHFGNGLVPTPNNFGRQGKLPTHPELLDYLADRFRAEGWSIKAMHRTIMLSRTYRQSSLRDSQSVLQDPENQWLAGYPRRRLDAEAIRDTLLAVSKDLDLSKAGAHPFPPEHAWDFTQHKPFKATYPSQHRSIYLMTQRIQRHPFLAIFDGADPSTSIGSRMTSTTPLQALYFLNDPLVHDQASRLASRVLSEADQFSDRVQLAYELLFSRLPTDEEQHALEQFIAQARILLQAEGLSSHGLEDQAWQACIRSLVRLNEFVYLD